MKKTFTILLMLLTMQLFSLDIDKILTESYQSLKIPNLYGKFSVTLISKNGDQREIKAEAYQKLVGNQMNRLFLFNYPPTVRDTGFLIHSYYGEISENKMWIYLPIVKKIKRISLESSGDGAFMGSDFTYADFISKSTDDYSQEYIGDEEIEGFECYAIKEYGSTEKLKKSLGYAYIINYYRKDDSFLLGKDYYEYSGELKKKYRVKEVYNFEEYIYPSKIEMEDLINSHKSIIEVSDIKFENIDDKYFTTRFLESKNKR